jgi:hypothetical protein
MTFPQLSTSDTTGRLVLSGTYYREDAYCLKFAIGPGLPVSHSDTVPETYILEPLPS